MKIINLFYVILFLSINSYANGRVVGYVIGITDGDTLTILDNSKQLHKIRLANIDAPEKSQDFGMVSKKNLSNICFKQSAIAEIQSKDRYGREVGVVYCKQIEANYKQVNDGFAWAYRKYSNDPKYLNVEAQAKYKKSGLWQMSSPIPPWEYRRGKN